VNPLLKGKIVPAWVKRILSNRKGIPYDFRAINGKDDQVALGEFKLCTGSFTLENLLEN
jgi:hypothetical protein